MVSRELYSDLKAIPPLFVRLDGRSFHRLARALSLKKPFDHQFSEAMAMVCSQLLEGSGLSATVAFTFSDEINLFLPLLPFNGRVEKIDSVCAAFAASALTIALLVQKPIAFDGRILPVDREAAVEYLVERQQETWRNHMNAYCQQAFIEDGMTPREAANSLKGRPSSELHEMMYARGINLAHTPAWQRRGILVYKSTEERTGYNPIAREEVSTTRSVVMVDRDLPLFSTEMGRNYLTSHLFPA